MRNIFKIFMADLTRVRTNVVAIVVMVGLIVIPCLYSWFNILSNWDPYSADATGRIKVAVYSADEGASLEGLEINVGESLIEGLKANNTIGWVFTDSYDDAVNGTNDGTYYAALIVEKDFSENLIGFISGDLSNPVIKYYCNQKKNAIAPKITDKAKTAVVLQVNQTFISTIVSKVLDAGDSVYGVGESNNISISDSLMKTLTSTKDSLQLYKALVDSMVSIIDMTDSIGQSAGGIAPQLSDSLNVMQGQLSAIKRIVDSNRLSQLDSLSGVISSNISDINALLGNIDTTASGLQATISSYGTGVKEAKESVKATSDMLNEIDKKLGDTIELLNGIKNGETTGLLAQVLDTNPETLGDFISSPVKIDTVRVFDIENYGSAASPFYMILALWVGALCMVAIMHAPVHPAKDIPENATRVQKFFGRYLLFYSIGQAQALLMSLGSLLFIGTQCYHPIMYWFACSFTSFVFTAIMYSLAAAFGNIGEATAIILMVIQVAGSGGTFPIETLPTVYQMIYKILPFPYAMDAIRECVAGTYKATYAQCLGVLLIFAIIFFVIGLIMMKPFEKMNHMIDKSKENSGVML